MAVDVAKVFGDLHRVNGESAGRWLKIPDLKTRIQAFAGLDPAAAGPLLEVLLKAGVGLAGRRSCRPDAPGLAPWAEQA